MVGVAAAAAACGVVLWTGGSLSLVSPAFAAVRFEVRLAEDRPGPGLREAPVGAEARVVYLHDHVLVSNADVVSARVVPGAGTERCGVELTIGTSGRDRMRTATRGHIGRPLALLIDGYVVLAPTLRSEIGDTALLSGDFTRVEAERIVRGVTIH